MYISQSLKKIFLIKKILHHLLFAKFKLKSNLNKNKKKKFILDFLILKIKLINYKQYCF